MKAIEFMTIYQLSREARVFLYEAIVIIVDLSIVTKTDIFMKRKSAFLNLTKFTIATLQTHHKIVGAGQTSNANSDNTTDTSSTDDPQSLNRTGCARTDTRGNEGNG
jgi:hypothetical protein